MNTDSKKEIQILAADCADCAGSKKEIQKLAADKERLEACSFTTKDAKGTKNIKKYRKMDPCLRRGDRKDVSPPLPPQGQACAGMTTKIGQFE